MMNMIIKELDVRNKGEGSYKASRISVHRKPNNDLKQSLIQHLGDSTANRNTNLSQGIINQTALDPGRTLRS